MITTRGASISGIFAILAVLGAFQVAHAQSIPAAGESLKNAVTGPIQELMGPFEQLKSQLQDKLPQTTSNVDVNSVKRFFEQNGVTYSWASNIFTKISDWVSARMKDFNSPGFIGWAVDFLKRIFLMIFELLNKIVSYL